MSCDRGWAPRGVGQAPLVVRTALGWPPCALGQKGHGQRWPAWQHSRSELRLLGFSLSSLSFQGWWAGCGWVTRTGKRAGDAGSQPSRPLLFPSSQELGTTPHGFRGVPGAGPAPAAMTLCGRGLFPTLRLVRADSREKDNMVGATDLPAAPRGPGGAGGAESVPWTSPSFPPQISCPRREV